jgi:hypothetical protein
MAPITAPVDRAFRPRRSEAYRWLSGWSGRVGRLGRLGAGGREGSESHRLANQLAGVDGARQLAGPADRRLERLEDRRVGTK